MISGASGCGEQHAAAENREKRVFWSHTVYVKTATSAGATALHSTPHQERMAATLSRRQSRRGAASVLKTLRTVRHVPIPCDTTPPPKRPDTARPPAHTLNIL